jgi:hypothetical protein
MTSELSGPLAKIVRTTPVGSRLNFLPHPSRELAPAAWIWVRGGGALALAVSGFVTMFTGLLIHGLNWFVLYALTAAAAFVIIFTIAMSFAVRAAWARPRSVELQTAGTPPQVVVTAGWHGRGSEVIPLADVSRVVVCERLKLGRRSALNIVLHVGGDKLVTLAADSYATKQIGTKELTSWLSEQLSPAHVTVERDTEIHKEFLRPDEWWQAGTVASVWQVPAGRVPLLAAQHGVRTYVYTPREFAMYSPNKTVTVYDPGGAYEVAKELHAGRVAKSKA